MASVRCCTKCAQHLCSRTSGEALIAIVTTARMFQLLLWLLLEASHEEVVVGLPAHFHQSLSLGHVWKGLLCQFSQLQDVLRMEGSRYEPGVGVVIP